MLFLMSENEDLKLLNKSLRWTELAAQRDPPHTHTFILDVFLAVIIAIMASFHSSLLLSVGLLKICGQEISCSQTRAWQNTVSWFYSNNNN